MSYTNFMFKVNKTVSGPRTHLRLRGEEGAGHSVQVLRVDLDADIVEAHLVEVQHAPSGADITLPGIG